MIGTLIKLYIENAKLEPMTPPTETTMDDVLKEAYEKIFSLQKYEKSNMYNTYSDVSKTAMQRWEQLTSAPLLKRIEELSNENKKAGEIANAMIEDSNKFRKETNELKQRIEELEKRNTDLVAYTEYVKRRVLKSEFPMTYDAYK